MMENLLNVANLCIDFSINGKLNNPVDGVSFELNKGECLGIVGESGSGKTLTALALMQLLPAGGKITKGEILFIKKDKSLADVIKLNRVALRSYRGNEVAMIFQEPMTSLNPVYTCGSQVIETLRLHRSLSNKESRERTLELFNRVKLPRPKEILKSYPHQLSGGQRQRVMIAMAISCEPSLLIADEPTTALDVTIQSSILTLLRELKETTGMSILFISHDLSVISGIANRIIVLYKGKIAEQGNVKDILSNPQNPYTKGLIACRPPLDERPALLPVVADFMNPETGKENNTATFISSAMRNVMHKRMYEKEPILEINNLETWYKSRNRTMIKALDGVSIQVFPGETLGIVGESGSGKTTFGRTLLQLIKAHSGSIKFHSLELTKLNDKEMKTFHKKMQIIFQDPYSSLNPFMTIEEILTEPMKAHHLYSSDAERRSIAVDLLEKVNLDDTILHRYPHEFSGGQRQRICIARAISLQPELIICDECVSALDVSLQAQVINLLSQLKNIFGLTYIFISHDISLVKYFSDRMIVMSNGRIIESGEADEVFFHPKEEYTRTLINAIPSLNNKSRAE